MKSKVLKTFRDSESGRILLPGQSIEVKQKARLNALIQKGFLHGEVEKEAEEKPKAKAKAKPKDGE